jgi:hypothetical protein
MIQRYGLKHVTFNRRLKLKTFFFEKSMKVPDFTGLNLKINKNIFFI